MNRLPLPQNDPKRAQREALAIGAMGILARRPRRKRKRKRFILTSYRLTISAELHKRYSVYVVT